LINKTTGIFVIKRYLNTYSKNSKNSKNQPPLISLFYDDNYDYNDDQKFEEFKVIINDLYSKQSLFKLNELLLKIYKLSDGSDSLKIQEILYEIFKFIESKVKIIEGVNNKGYVNNINLAEIDLYYDELLNVLNLEDNIDYLSSNE